MTDPLPPGVVARQEYVNALSEERDILGREQPRMFSFIRLVTRFTARDWKQVPSEYWAVDLNAEGYSVAVVSCVCGETPRPEALAPAVRCGCGRYFYFGGDRVLSIRSPEDA